MMLKNPTYRAQNAFSGDLTWKTLIILISLFCFHITSAQLSLPLNQYVTQKIEAEAVAKNSNFITCLKPFNEQQLRGFLSIDSILAFDHKTRQTWFGRKLLAESFMKLDSPSFYIAVDPLFNLQIGQEQQSGKRLWINTRGARVRGVIGKSLGFESSFYENQGFFAPYWDSYIQQYRVSPGQGRAKRYKTTGWDYAFSSGYLQWQASKVINVQFGHDKLFIGDGYRSLLLSDATTNYPFLKFSFTWKRVQYTRIVASMMNLDYKILGLDTKAFPKKTANFHLISFSLPKRVQLSLFEGTMLRNPNQQGVFKLNYYVISPIPFTDMLKPNHNSINPIVGTNLRWEIVNGLSAYNQWVVDYSKASSVTNYGFQAGVKYSRLLGAHYLFLQAEYNLVMPYTYSDRDSVLAYTHYSQPLAHPLGANFKEYTGVGRYQYKHFMVTGKITLASYGNDLPSANNGKNPLNPSPLNPKEKLLQGTPTNLLTAEGFISYYFNPKNQTNLSAGFYIQKNNAVPTSNISLFYVAFRTSLTNLYYDFR